MTMEHLIIALTSLSLGVSIGKLIGYREARKIWKPAWYQAMREKYGKAPVKGDEGT